MNRHGPFRRRRMTLGVVAALGIGVAASAFAQNDDYTYVFRQCRDNGFTEEACRRHAEKVFENDRQYQDRSLQEHRRRARELKDRASRRRGPRAPRRPVLR